MRAPSSSRRRRAAPGVPSPPEAAVHSKKGDTASAQGTVLSRIPVHTVSTTPSRRTNDGTTTRFQRRPWQGRVRLQKSRSLPRPATGRRRRRGLHGVSRRRRSARAGDRHGGHSPAHRPLTARSAPNRHHRCRARVRSSGSGAIPVMTRSTASMLVLLGSMSSAATRPRWSTTIRSTTWKTWWILWAMKMQE